MRRLVPLMLAALLACDADSDEPSTAEAYCELEISCNPGFAVEFGECVASVESPQMPDACVDTYMAEIQCIADTGECGQQSSEGEACGDLVQARIDCVNSH